MLSVVLFEKHGALGLVRLNEDAVYELCTIDGISSFVVEKELSQGWVGGRFLELLLADGHGALV